MSGWVASHFKSQSNIVYSLWLWRAKTNTGDPDLHYMLSSISSNSEFLDFVRFANFFFSFFKFCASLDILVMSYFSSISSFISKVFDLLKLLIKNASAISSVFKQLFTKSGKYKLNIKDISSLSAFPLLVANFFISAGVPIISSVFSLLKKALRIKKFNPHNSIKDTDEPLLLNELDSIVNNGINELIRLNFNKEEIINTIRIDLINCNLKSIRYIYANNIIEEEENLNTENIENKKIIGIEFLINASNYDINKKNININTNNSFENK